MFENTHINQCTVTLTRNCNLRCDFCYAKRTNYKKNDMITLDELKKIVDFCCETKIKYLVFTGGEPTLYSELAEVLYYIKKVNMNIVPTIASNGLMFSDLDYCNKLVGNGLAYIDVSLKGKNNNECFKTVGIECFDLQMQAIRNLATLNVDFTCSMVLNHSNVDSFCELVETAKNNGAKQFSFTFVIDNEKSGRCNQEYIKGNNPFKLISLFMSRIENLNEITSDWWIEFSYPICFFTKEQLIMLKGKLASPCHVRKENGITFDTQMNLIPCNMYIEDKMEQFGVDFCSNESFRSVLKNGKYKKKINEINHYPSTECENCEYLNICNGGCPVTWKNYDYQSMVSFRDMYYKK